MPNKAAASAPRTLSIDYQELFLTLPNLYLLIAPDTPRFTIVNANLAHMEQTGLKPEQFIGKAFFDVWPDVTQKRKSTGVSDVKESLERVIKTKKPDEMGVLRYHIPSPDGKSFQTFFWKPVHLPILDKDGNVSVILQANQNVTQETLIQQRLERTQTHLDEALSIGLVGTWVWDITANKVIADKNLSAMFGVSAEEGAEGLPLETFVNAIHPDDRERIENQIAKTLIDGGDYEAQYRTISKDGDERYVIARGRIEKDAEGNLLKFPGVVVDITDSKRAEEALNKSEAELKFMAESMPQKVFTATASGEIDYFNPQWMEFTGLSFDEIKGWGWLQFIHDDDKELTAAAWKEAVEKGDPYQFEHRFRRADGEYRWHLTRANPMHDSRGKIIKWIGSNTDITERKQDELKLTFLSRASKILSSSLDYDLTIKKIAKLVVPTMADWCSIDMINDSGDIEQVIVTHKDPQMIKWAKQFRKTNPVSLDDKAGVGRVIRTGKIEYFANMSPKVIEDLVKTAENADEVKKLGLRSWISVPIIIDHVSIGAITLVHAEQKRSYNPSDVELIEELAHRVALAINNAQLYQSAKEELEVRRRLEQELLRANEQLEERVAKRTAELEVANQNLSRSNQELQDFAYVASHDLQEPLRKIQAFGNLLAEEYADQLDEGLDYLNRMKGAAARMSTLIEDLLSFSRVTTQARPFIPVDLASIMDDVLSDLETRIEDTKGTVTVTSLPTIMADPTQMRQLLQNLVGNALKFHKPQTPPQVVVSCESVYTKSGRIKQYRLIVSDNGIGFDEKYLDRIFSVFQRLHARSSFEGTGIGLAVCRKIVERHGGTVTAKSKEGEGSKFIITLPAKTVKERSKVS